MKKYRYYLNVYNEGKFDCFFEFENEKELQEYIEWHFPDDPVTFDGEYVANVFI